MYTVDGARPHLVYWTCSLKGTRVCLALYMDSWVSTEAHAAVEQVVIHVHGKGLFVLFSVILFNAYCTMAMLIRNHSPRVCKDRQRRRVSMDIYAHRSVFTAA